jgi:hypothetical protein
MLGSQHLNTRKNLANKGPQLVAIGHTYDLVKAARLPGSPVKVPPKVPIHLWAYIALGLSVSMRAVKIVHSGL